jgi:hypothetical protein
MSGSISFFLFLFLAFLIACLLFYFLSFFRSFFLSFFCGTGAWTQGLHLELLHQPYFCEGVFKIVSHETICLGWFLTTILLISATWVAMITGVSHWSQQGLSFLSVTWFYPIVTLVQTLKNAWTLVFCKVNTVQVHSPLGCVGFPTLVTQHLLFSLPLWNLAEILRVKKTTLDLQNIIFP